MSQLIDTLMSGMSIQPVRRDNDTRYALCYRTVPLWWVTGPDYDRRNDRLSFVKIDGSGYAFQFEDSEGDSFFYGNFSSKRDARLWLENPVPLY